MEVETPENDEPPSSFPMSNTSSSVSVSKSVLSSGYERRSKRLLKNKETPPIQLPNISLDDDNFSTPIQKTKKKKIEQMKFNWVSGKKMNF